jgi:hypothetical protein
MAMKIKLAQIQILIAGLIMIAAASQAKAQNTDLRGRLGADFSTSFLNNWGLSIAAEQRFMSNLSRFDRSILETDVSYNIDKQFRVGAAWRTMLNQSARGNMSFRHRGSTYIRYRVKYDDFDFRLKSSLQYGIDDLTNSFFLAGQNLVNRNSLTVRYNWFGKPITPEVGCEMYYHINNPQGSVVNKFRIKAGASYAINKTSSVKVFYYFDNEFNVAYPTDAHVLGFSYSFGL